MYFGWENSQRAREDSSYRVLDVALGGSYILSLNFNENSERLWALFPFYIYEKP